MKIDLSGSYEVTTNEVSKVKVVLPGSLDTNGIGHEDLVARPWHPDIAEKNKNMENDSKKDPRINSRFTRNHTYEGPACFERIIEEDIPEEGRIFLVAERARALSLKVDGMDIPKKSGSLSTRYVFEVTGFLRKGSKLSLTTDNSYPGLPYEDIVFSSAATDETQTNWNGIAGALYLDTKEEAFISNLTIYPHTGLIDVRVEIDIPKYRLLEDDHRLYSFKLCSEYLQSDIEKEISAAELLVNPAVELCDLELSANYRDNLWDEYEGKMCSLSAFLYLNTDMLSEKKARFGIRDFSFDRSGRLTLNERRIFLRSEANCAVFPETGFPPTDKKSWTEIINTYKAYGVNCVRFHSWCPPEAAFEAADEAGMLLQPELSNWNPRTAFSTTESRNYYREELLDILKSYANHPSFVMLTLGNELFADNDGLVFIHDLLSLAKSIDKTRLFSWGSNNFYGEKGCDEESDFYTSACFMEEHIRLSGNTGIFNRTYPESKKSFNGIMSELRKKYDKPVFSFEVGQYEILPDMDELDDFKGVTRADNLAIVRDKLKALNIDRNTWKQRVEATGELALLSYREEVEAVLRTPSMSGISLLGLQDFPGQGTALVGMLNSHLKSKPFSFASPDRFKSFFSDRSILVFFDKYTYTSKEILKAVVKIANYGKTDIEGSVRIALIDNSSKKELASVRIDNGRYPIGELTDAGIAEFALGITGRRAAQLSLVAAIDDGSLSTTYPIWVYEDIAPKCPAGIYETEIFDEKAVSVLENGGDVYLTPPSTKEAMPNSAQAQFSTDFWSVGTFPSQEGTMGQLINASHPIFKDFPTQTHTNYQWYPMASQRALILHRYIDTIIAEMDSFAKLRPMTQLMEVKCLSGRLMISSMGLQKLTQYPEARALLCSIYDYMTSDAFKPEEAMTPEEVKALFQE